MAASKEQLGPKQGHWSMSWREYKKRYNRFLRRMAKKNPENAWKKHYYFGYYW